MQPDGSRFLSPWLNIQDPKRQLAARIHQLLIVFFLLSKVLPLTKTFDKYTVNPVWQISALHDVYAYFFFCIFKTSLQLWGVLGKHSPCWRLILHVPDWLIMKNHEQHIPSPVRSVALLIFFYPCFAAKQELKCCVSMWVFCGHRCRWKESLSGLSSLICHWKGSRFISISSFKRFVFCDRNIFENLEDWSRSHQFATICSMFHKTFHERGLGNKFCFMHCLTTFFFFLIIWSLASAANWLQRKKKKNFL